MTPNEELSELLEPRETLPEADWFAAQESPKGAWIVGADPESPADDADGEPLDEKWYPVPWDDWGYFPVLLKALEARGIHDWGVNGVSGRGGARPTIDADVGDSTTNDIVEIAATDVDDIPRALRDAALAALRKEAT